MSIRTRLAALGDRLTGVVRALVSAPRSPRRVLPYLAFCFTAAILFVTVVDPYSGQYADATTAPNQWEHHGGQQYTTGGGYTIPVARGQFGASAVPVHAGGDVPPASGTPTPGSARAIAKAMLTAKGMGEDQYSCLDSLWARESQWSVTAANPSGAYGIPQALPGKRMASVGSDWRTSAKTQIIWGLQYIAGRYGKPCDAWAHSQAHGWY